MEFIDVQYVDIITTRPTVLYCEVFFQHSPSPGSLRVGNDFLNSMAATLWLFISKASLYNALPIAI